MDHLKSKLQSRLKRSYCIIRLKSVKNVSISLSDVNDNAPYFPHGQYHVSVLENNNIGDVITQLKANDADVGENARISYSLTVRLLLYCVRLFSRYMILLCGD